MRGSTPRYRSPSYSPLISLSAGAVSRYGLLVLHWSCRSTLACGPRPCPSRKNQVLPMIGAMGTENDNQPGSRDAIDARRLYEERLTTLLELSSEWYWEQDEQYRHTLVIGARSGQTGNDPQQYLGTAQWDH